MSTGHPRMFPVVPEDTRKALITIFLFFLYPLLYLCRAVRRSVWTLPNGRHLLARGPRLLALSVESLMIKQHSMQVSRWLYLRRVWCRDPFFGTTDAWAQFLLNRHAPRCRCRERYWLRWPTALTDRYGSHSQTTGNEWGGLERPAHGNDPVVTMLAQPG